MALNISAWSIRHPLPPLVIGLAIVALGYLSFNKLPITRMPNVDVPFISVIITQFGAAPAEPDPRRDARGGGPAVEVQPVDGRLPPGSAAAQRTPGRLAVRILPVAAPRGIR